MLSFIGFWRAAAIVLSDLASSAYYAGGIAETTIGKPAPWFILGVMLFGFAIRAIYLESCSMFVRGGVYRVVHDSLGPAAAKISVSALMFDYVLTGPISAVSAGLYLAGFLNDIADYLHRPWHVPPRLVAVVFALFVTVYFWFENTVGLQEASEKALRIMQVTTVMVVILIAWCVWTAATRGFQPVPLPTRQNLHFGSDALGWLEGTAAANITLIAWMVGMGHSLLAMSGFETLAQVYREIEAPKLENLKRTSLVVILYALVFTSSVAFFAVMLIPDADRPRYLDNLIGGLAMFLAGPPFLKLLFHALVVLVGTLILAGAVNTAIVGSNGVLNRVAEDGVLPDWFREPHPRYGTTSRLLNLIVLLQVATILLSRGNVLFLGEAYAFGVIWSFTIKSLGVLVLRYRRPEARAWKVPLNPRIRGRELPLGLILITFVLFLMAVVNLLTKKTATIAGSAFTAAFFAMFRYAEEKNRGRREKTRCDFEKFRFEEPPELSPEALHVRPGNILVYASDASRLEHLDRVLAETDTEKQNVILLVVHHLAPSASAEHELSVNQICASRELEILTKAVAVAEKAGRPVTLVVVPARDPYCAVVHTAQQLQSSRIVVRQLPATTADEIARRLGRAWERLPARVPLTVEIVPDGDRESLVYLLGPHTPELRYPDIELVHRLWRELTDRYGFGTKLHHRDIVGAALHRFGHDLDSQPEAVLDDVRREMQTPHSTPP
jgi:amino acid transporter